ncbi:hypothetical protein EV13_2071 [Prochlorococcus sp. MIT 0702]|nr:hypothetical protein EV13_2071 [Prochlorococcus sp. MIT 0702]KGG37281.1 hypothetical protein EV14_0073 [Prochlorococcus sp. MIT 0703]
MAAAIEQQQVQFCGVTSVGCCSDQVMAGVLSLPSGSNCKT